MVYSACPTPDVLIYAPVKLLSDLKLQGMRIDTKIYPETPGDHAPAKLKATFKDSLKAMNGQKIRVFYLHAPDRSVPFEDTLEAVDELHRAGYLCVSWHMARHDVADSTLKITARNLG